MNDHEYDLNSKILGEFDPSFFQNKFRVKLYNLNPAGQWDDMGTGHVSIKEENEDFYIKLVSELNDEVMFEMKLTNHLEFRRQRGTILTWKSRAEEEDDDSAISFQEKEGIREVWRFLCHLKGKSPQEEKYDEEDDEESELLPEPTVENLPYIAREIRPDWPASKINRIIEHITHNRGNYIKKIGDVLEQEEKKLEEKKSEKSTQVSGPSNGEELNFKDLENLSLIFTIFKNLFYIADQNMIELLVSNELYMITFGALEYDFESQKMIKHRQFFKELAKFHNILNLTDQNLINRIHFNHRLAYLRDTAIGRFIDDQTVKHINILIHYTNSDIILYFLTNKSYLKSIIEKIKQDDLDIKSQGLNFILELIASSKELLQTRILFYETICELDILEALENTLVDVTHYSKYEEFLKIMTEDNITDRDFSKEENERREKIKINSIEILINILTIVPGTLKTYIISKSQKIKEHPLLTELCNILIHQENFGIKYEIGELLKSLLDNEVSEKKHDFYDLFYNKCLKNLANFLKIPIKEKFRYEMISSKQIVIEILCHCLKQHEQRVRYWVIHNDLISKVMEAVKDNSKILELQVTKFIKSVIVNNDENLNKMIINHDIFSHIILIYNRHKSKDNAISSAILDLFEYIRKQNLKKIIFYLIDKHYDFFYKDNRATFASLIAVYEKNYELNSTNKSLIEEDILNRKFPGISNREFSAKEDEDYFDHEDEDEDDIFKHEVRKIFNNIPNQNNNNNSSYISKSSELKEICSNISLNSNNEICDKQDKQDFLGKKTSSENELLNIYKELHEDEALEISKALIAKKERKESGDLDEEEEF